MKIVEWANVAGRSVIAHGADRVLNTQIPVTDNPSAATALYFQEQTVESLIGAVHRFEQVESYFDPQFIRQHAERFDEAIFIDKIRIFVHQKFSELNARQLSR